MKNLSKNVKLKGSLKQEIIEFLKDGLSVRNTARYIGISEGAIYYMINPKRRAKAIENSKKWRMNNPEKYRKYHCEYRRSHRIALQNK